MSPKRCTRAVSAHLLIDLLTQTEEAVDLRTRELRFDIDLLADRLVGATWWLAGEETTRALPVGLFGASTGAAAALVAAAGRADHVAAVVSRGGRPDLAGASLPNVRTPTLLIVGGSDGVVIDLNQRAMALMTRRCGSRSCLALRTCSRSRARWIRWRGSPATGSSGTSQRPGPSRRDKSCHPEERQPFVIPSVSEGSRLRSSWPATSDRKRDPSSLSLLGMTKLSLLGMTITSRSSAWASARSHPARCRPAAAC